MSKQKENGQDQATAQEEQIISTELPISVLSQYIRDLSFENPEAVEYMQSGKGLPEMDINIGMDARKIPDQKIKNLFEVVLNIRAEAKTDDKTVFIAELLYGVSVVIQDNAPEESYHPMLLIEIPRMAFPFARQILSNLTVQAGYPPLLLAPVDFRALYMQRFGKEMEEAKKKFEAEQEAKATEEKA